MTKAIIKGTSRKALPFLLTVVLIIGLMPANTQPVYAADAVTVDIYASYQYNGYQLPKTLLNVSSDLSDKYYDYDEGLDGVSALDVLIAAHKEFYILKEVDSGPYDEGAFKTWLKGSLVIDDPYGTMGVETLFEDTTSWNNSFALNGVMPFDTSITFPASAFGPESYLALSASEVEVDSGDYVEFFSYLDGMMYSDCYTWFEYEGNRIDSLYLTADTAKNEFKMYLRGYPYMSYGSTTDESFRDGSKIDGDWLERDIVLLDPSNGVVIDGIAYASDEGDFSFDNTAGNIFTAPGTNILSASIDDGYDQYIFAPWLEVKIFAAGIDFDDLMASIALAEAKEKALYTTESWAAFTDALIAAKNLAPEGVSTQSDIDAVVAALNVAMNGLKLKTDKETQKESISAAVVSGVKDVVYDGKAKTPDPKVSMGIKGLTKGTDYNVAYLNNKNVGKASVVITGKGNYEGSKTVCFKILPKKQKVASVKSAKKKQLTVKWKKDSQVTGYQVAIGTDKKISKNKKTAIINKKAITKKTFKKLKAGKVYYAKIRAYKIIDGKKVYGDWSKIKKMSGKVKK